MNGNSFILWLLRSPLHGLISRNTMIVTCTGRKSGRLIAVPVNYIRDRDTLWVISFRNRVWWHNLRGDGKATLRVAGTDYPATGEVIESAHAVAANLGECLRLAPQYARYLNVPLDAADQPDPDFVIRAAADRVIIRSNLSARQPASAVTGRA